MRTRFRRDLGELSEQLRTICLLDRTALATATRALLDADLAAAERAIDMCGRITALCQNSERAATRLLALQAPVASDLRQVVTALHLVTDLARMGAQAKRIALIARRRHPAQGVPASVRPAIVHIAEGAVAMAAGASALLDSHDPVEATRLANRDAVVGELRDAVLGSVLRPDWSYGIGVAVDLALLAGYYERFADHAVRVGHWTVFVATGRPPRQVAAEQAP
ncbi:phosphate signaling complex PhoU family protein [Nocardia sp. NPDC101769]|uniref:phosphate signaling complex PhoU family protein n=1 Tax=Nocardia sp. NPDC101769 TaxID=3364333 RepID=UPI0037FBD99C